MIAGMGQIPPAEPGTGDTPTDRRCGYSKCGEPIPYVGKGRPPEYCPDRLWEDSNRTCKELARDEAISRTNKENGIRPGRSRHISYLNVPRFEAFLVKRNLDLTSYKAVAEYLGIGVGTVYNALNGARVGAPFITALGSKMRGGEYRLQDFLISDEQIAKSDAA